MRASMIVLGAAVAILLAAHPLHRRHEMATTSRTPTAPIVLAAPAQSSSATSPQTPPSTELETTRHARLVAPDARNIAGRFMTAYLRWQSGKADRTTTDLLEATATPRLWRELRSGVALPTARKSVPAERLRKMVAGVGSQRAATLLAELDRRQDVSTLAVVVKRTAQGWRVTSLGR